MSDLAASKHRGHRRAHEAAVHQRRLACPQTGTLLTTRPAIAHSAPGTPTGCEQSATFTATLIGAAKSFVTGVAKNTGACLVGKACPLGRRAKTARGAKEGAGSARVHDGVELTAVHRCLDHRDEASPEKHAELLHCLCHRDHCKSSGSLILIVDAAESVLTEQDVQGGTTLQ